MEEALHVAFEQFIFFSNLGQPSSPLSLEPDHITGSHTEYFTACYRLGIHINISTPLLPHVVEHLNKVISLLETRADYLDFRDAAAESIVKSALSSFLQRGMILSSLPNIINNNNDGAGEGELTCSVTVGTVSGYSSRGIITSTVGHKGDGGGGDICGAEFHRMTAAAKTEDPNAIELGLHLVDSIYSVQYTNAYSRITYLMRFLITVILNSTHDHMYFALSVYERILNYVQRMHIFQIKRASCASFSEANDSVDSFSSVGHNSDLTILNPSIVIWEYLAKEFKEHCSLLELHLSQSEGNARIIRYAVGLLLLCHATIPFLPLNSSIFHTEFRCCLLRVAYYYCGFPEHQLLHSAAENCARILLESKTIDVMRESQEQLRRALLYLTDSYYVMNLTRSLSIIKVTLQSNDIRELNIETRHCINSALYQFCTRVYQQNNNITNNETTMIITRVLTALLPFVCMIDSDQGHQSVYVACILQPLRQMTSLDMLNVEALEVVYSLVACVDYNSIEQEHRALIEQVVIEGIYQEHGDGLSMGLDGCVSRLTKSMVCWLLLASIIHLGHPSSFIESVGQHCIAAIETNRITPTLLSALEMLKRVGNLPWMKQLIEAVDKRSFEVLKNVAMCVESCNNVREHNIEKSMNNEGNEILERVVTPIADFRSHFGEKLRHMSSRHMSEGDLVDRTLLSSQEKWRSLGSAFLSSNIAAEKAAAAMHEAPHIEEVLCAIKVAGEKVLHLFTKSTQESNLKADYEYWKSIKGAIGFLSAHPVSVVRQTFSAVVANILKRVFRLVSSLSSSPSLSSSLSLLWSAFFPRTPVTYPYTNTLIYNDLAHVVEEYVRRVVLESDPYVKAISLCYLSEGEGTMEGHLVYPLKSSVIPPNLISDNVIRQLVGLLQEPKRIRESALTVLLCISNSDNNDNNNTSNSNRIQTALKGCLVMHIQSLVHVKDTNQVARSCAVVNMLLSYYPVLLTSDITTALMRNIYNNLQAQNSTANRLQRKGRTLAIRSSLHRNAFVGSSAASDGNGSQFHPHASSQQTMPEGSMPERRDFSEDIHLDLKRRICEKDPCVEMIKTVVLLQLLNGIFAAMKVIQRLNFGPFSHAENIGSPLPKLSPNDKSDLVTVFSESAKTKQLLDTLWDCLIMASKSITAVFSSIQETLPGKVTSPVGKRNSYDMEDNFLPIENEFHPSNDYLGSPLNFSIRHAGGIRGPDCFPTSGSLSTTAMMTNAIAIQHQALCALTSLITMSPQDNAEFTHKTVFMEFLCTEYLRYCGLIHAQNNDSIEFINNDVAALVEKTANHRNRLSIIRLFGLLGAMDPAKGGLNMNTADSSTIVVEGDTVVPKVQRGSTKRDRNIMSVRTRAMILKNVDSKKDVYPFAKEPNYAVTVYRVLVEIFATPRAANDRALRTALRVALHLLKEFPVEQLQGWDIIETVMSLARTQSSDVSPEMKLLILSALPELIRLRKKVAARLIQEFFMTVRQCWEHDNDRMCLSLLTLVKELHLINLGVSESCSSNCSSDCKSNSIVYAGVTIPTPINRNCLCLLDGDLHSLSGTSLYLALIDVAIRDHHPRREIAHKVIEILGLIEHQVAIAPVIVGNFIEQIVRNLEEPVELRVAATRMAALLISRFNIDTYVSPCVNMLYSIVWDNMKINYLTKHSIIEVGEAVRLLLTPQLVLEGSYPHTLLVSLQGLVKQAQSLPAVSLSLQTVLNVRGAGDMMELPTISTDFPTTNCNLDAFVCHVNKALNDGLRRGSNFAWGVWFYEFQRCVLLHSPHSAFRITFEIFEQHEPCRKALFYPGFHCLLMFLLTDVNDPAHKLAANAVRKPLRKVLSQLLKYADSETVDVCLGLHDYLERYRNPNPDESSTSSNVGRIFASGSNVSNYSHYDPQCNIPNNAGDMTINTFTGHQSPHGSGVSTITVGFLAPCRTQPFDRTTIVSSFPQLVSNSDSVTCHVTITNDNRLLFVTNTDKNHHKAEFDLEDSEFPRQTDHGLRKCNSRQQELPWSLFNQDELARSALYNGLYFKTVRYLERELVTLVDFKDKYKPGNLPVDQEPIVSDKHDAVRAIINSIAQQYNVSGPLGQYSIVGLYSATEVGIDVAGYELLKLWNEANSIYKKRINEHERHPNNNTPLFRPYLSPVSVRTIMEGSPIESMTDESESLLASPPSPIIQGIRSVSKHLMTDITGYLRTLCYCGKWEEALQFARKHISVLKQIPHSTKGIGKHYKVLTSSKKQNVSECESPLYYATLCSIVLNQWDDARLFDEMITDKATALLFRYLCIAQTEIDNNITSNTEDNIFRSVVSTSSPLPEGVMHSMTSIEKNFAKALIAMDEELMTMLPLSYSHSYNVIIRLQHFQEIEEARLYSRTKTSENFRKSIRRMWFQRFQVLKTDALSMLTSVLIYSLVTTPREIPDIFYYFSKAVRATYPALGIWAITSLQTGELQRREITSISSPLLKTENKTSAFIDLLTPSTLSLPTYIYSSEKNALLSGTSVKDALIDYYEYLWSTGLRSRAIAGLTMYLEHTTDAVQPVNDTELKAMQKTTGLAHVLMGIWLQEMQYDKFWKRGYREDILAHLQTAVGGLSEEYITWHSWGVMNYRVHQRDTTLNPAERTIFLLAAHRGLVTAVCRVGLVVLVTQSLLRLLQLWSDSKVLIELELDVIDAIDRIPVASWCHCIPQIVAHLGDEDLLIWRNMRILLEKICRAYPQICVFNLLAPILSDLDNVEKKLRPSRAKSLLEFACPPQLLQQARHVAEGLIQLAVFPIEAVHEIIGDVVRDLRNTTEPLAGDHYDAVLNQINIALNLAEKHEKSFEDVGDVAQVLHMLKSLVECPDKQSDAAIYGTQLFSELQEHVNEMNTISLKGDSVSLSQLSELCVWVPDEYSTDVTEAPTIFAFVDQVDIITDTKRRPRRVHIVGSDGHINTYCLKGNEDLRVDVRAMQMFGMINSLSNVENISSVPVIPFSETVGMLGWLESSETLYKIIQTYRSRANLSQYSEQAVIKREYDDVMCPAFHHLVGLQKADLFEQMFKESACNDLKQVFFYRSVNAELWLKRRTALTASLAYASPAGYVLGLGDRHPGNLLIQVSTGSVMHIDFGDCFDVARYRQNIPETVPFRLTPMLINAMEVFGVCGIFQFTCESSMELIRENRDSVHALLGAFAKDPAMCKRISQQKLGTVNDVLDMVRRKLRGLEMTFYVYSQNEKGAYWDPNIVVREQNNSSFTQLDNPERIKGLANETPDNVSLFRLTNALQEGDPALKWMVDFDLSNKVLQPRPDLQFIASKELSEMQMHAFASRRDSLSTQEQIKILITEASKVENLCELFPGWTPWW